MSDFKPILDALISEGFYLLSDGHPKTGKPLDYNFTPYSLNTKLSFRFDSLADFVDFLKQSDPTIGDEQLVVLQTTFNELALKQDEFFYVNFFEKGKEVEM